MCTFTTSFYNSLRAYKDSQMCSKKSLRQWGRDESVFEQKWKYLKYRFVKAKLMPVEMCFFCRLFQCSAQLYAETQCIMYRTTVHQSVH